MNKLYFITLFLLDKFNYLLSHYYYDLLKILLWIIIDYFSFQKCKY